MTVRLIDTPPTPPKVMTPNGMPFALSSSQMTTLPPRAHDALFSEPTNQLGEVLWHLLRAEQLMDEKVRRRVKDGLIERSQLTDFGRQVGNDEIYWWIHNKEDDIEHLRAKTAEALAAVDHLKADSKQLRGFQPTSYDGLIKAIRQFAEKHAAEIASLHDYTRWLHSRDSLAPCILFTYRVWGHAQSRPIDRR